HGLYMIGKGYDVSPLSEEAKKLVSRFDKLVEEAVNAKDNYKVLDVAEEIYEQLKHLEDDHKAISDIADDAPQAKNLPDMVIESLDEHKLDPNYDEMEDSPMLKDENVDDEDTEFIPDTCSLDKYLSLIRNHTAHQSYLIQHLRNLVEIKRRRTKKRSIQRMQSTGTLDIKRLWKIPTGDIRVMKRRLMNSAINRDVDPNSLAVYILVDESHSMSYHDRIRFAREGVAVLGEVLNELEIPFAITGYTAGNKLVRLLYKRFEEDFISVRTRLVEISDRYETYTQEHIFYALRKLAPRRERKKVLLVITDAEGIESQIRFKKAVDMAKDSGVELLGLGINTDEIQQYFDKFVMLEDLQRFGEELLKLLRGVLLRR
ncbi:MAG: VWA domain-containing protein, partial [Candidatus Syntropharchaeales archaeon]